LTYIVRRHVDVSGNNQSSDSHRIVTNVGAVIVVAEIHTCGKSPDRAILD